jgi:hypothetical protein
MNKNNKKTSPDSSDEVEYMYMEEVEGFEPPRVVKPLSVFKTDPFSRTWVYLRVTDKNYNNM